MQRQRKRNRLRDFDYSHDALYFVTCCVKNMAHSFGAITDGKMICNQFGNIVEKQWHWLAEQYPYVALHGFVVMPNHIHGIIEINGVGTGRDLSLRDSIRDSAQDAGMKIKSLSELMGAFKTTSSKQIHKAGFTDFAWHRSFHDHIIRDENSLFKILDYIDTNPQRWEDDTYFLKA